VFNLSPDVTVDVSVHIFHFCMYIML